MIAVFDLLNRQQIKDFLPGQLTQLRNNATVNLSRISDHYRRSVYVVESNHILVQILQHLPSRYDLNDERYYRFCHAQSKMTHRALNLNTDTVLSGPASEPFFYGPGIKEFYLVEEIDLPYNFDADQYWQSLCPVRAISHPFTDLAFNARDGKNKRNVPGLAFLSIDIGLLAVQFRHWVRKTAGAEVLPSIVQFVFQYPLVNLIASDTDVCFFNRLRAQQGLIAFNDDTPRHGLAIQDLRAQSDKVWEIWTDRAFTATRRFIDLPAQMPLLFLDTVLEQIRIPDVFFNRQNLGLYTLAYMPYLTTLTRITTKSGSSDNRQVYTLMDRWYRRFITGGYLSAIPGINPQGIQQALLDEVLTPLQ